MRNHIEVIKQMMDKIPTSHIFFFQELEYIYKESFYKAPESKIPWDRACEILHIHIPIPKEQWEFEIVSIFTEISIDELKEKYNN